MCVCVVVFCVFFVCLFVWVGFGGGVGVLDVFCFLFFCLFLGCCFFLTIYIIIVFYGYFEARFYKSAYSVYRRVI